MKNSKGYLFGIIGGLLGGLLASIPWILMYIYGNMMFSALAIFIGMGSFYGYKWLKGTMNEKLPLIVTILSIVSVSVATLIIIPLLLLEKNGIEASFENLEWLYQNSEFVSAMLRDYIISVVFTFLGIHGVTTQLRKGKEPKFNLNTSQNDTIIPIKALFEKYDAMKKENAVSKDTILNEIEDSNIQNAFRTLCYQKIIRKHKKNYYFDEACERSVFRRFFLIYWSIMKWILLFIIIFGLFILFI